MWPQPQRPVCLSLLVNLLNSIPNLHTVCAWFTISIFLVCFSLPILLYPPHVHIVADIYIIYIHFLNEWVFPPEVLTFSNLNTNWYLCRSCLWENNSRSDISRWVKFILGSTGNINSCNNIRTKQRSYFTVSLCITTCWSRMLLLAVSAGSDCQVCSHHTVNTQCCAWGYDNLLVHWCYCLWHSCTQSAWGSYKKKSVHCHYGPWCWAWCKLGTSMGEHYRTGRIPKPRKLLACES